MGMDVEPPDPPVDLGGLLVPHLAPGRANRARDAHRRSRRSRSVIPAAENPVEFGVQLIVVRLAVAPSLVSRCSLERDHRGHAGRTSRLGTGLPGLRTRLLPRGWDADLAAYLLPLLRLSRARCRVAEDPVARLEAYPRHARARRGSPSEGRPGAPRARHDRDHARHLQPRDPAMQEDAATKIAALLER